MSSTVEIEKIDETGVKGMIAEVSFSFSKMMLGLSPKGTELSHV